LLLFRVRAFKCYLDVCLLVKVGGFPNYGAVVGKNGSFFFFIHFVPVGFVLNFRFQFLYEM
jgi:hypothetical protein